MSEQLKAEIGEWDKDFVKDENGKEERSNDQRLPFMKFEGPGTYTLRLVGSYVKFLRHWQPFTGRVITHPSYKGSDPAWNAKFYPRLTYAMHVIDRADGQLKLLEKGSSLFEQFSAYKTVNDINPGSKDDGPDWVITVEWPKTKIHPKGNKMQAKYKATAKVKPSPITEEEMEMINKSKISLKDFYQSTPLEKIVEMWEALPDEAKIKKERDLDAADDKGSKEETKSPTKPVDEEVTTGDDDDGLFDDGDDDSTTF
jgi:hypothetical protein